MLLQKLHADEVDIDTASIGLMIKDQFPQWAGLPLVPVSPSGTDNVMLRLGDELVVRLPRIASAVPALLKELRYSPLLGPQLPASVPIPLAQGEPGRGYPWPWTVSGWIDGKNPSPGAGAGMALAGALGQFIAVLHSIDTGDGRRRASLRSYRGGPLAARDAPTRAAMAMCEGLLDIPLLAAAWNACLQAPEERGECVWIHADLQPGNLLVRDGRLAAVLDWGGLSIGDPAVDLIVAWNLFDAAGRAAFREAIAVDEPMWARGRAWALSIGIIAYPYYVGTNASLAAVSRHQIGQVLTDLSLAPP